MFEAVSTDIKVDFRQQQQKKERKKEKEKIRIFDQEDPVWHLYGWLILITCHTVNLSQEFSYWLWKILNDMVISEYAYVLGFSHKSLW